MRFRQSALSKTAHMNRELRSTEFRWKAAAADLGLQVKLSIGIAYFDPESDDTDDAFLKKAGDALYKVKQGGRNSFLISV